MADSAAWLVDTNILLRMSKSDNPSHGIISNALRTLAAQGARICFTSQILGEFWNACTRPADRNGLGLSVQETDLLARIIERDFEFLPDNREIHDRWRHLIVAHKVKGVQVHDARIAANMYVHGIRHLLTLNDRDFQRFPLLPAMHPSEVVHTAGGV